VPSTRWPAAPLYDDVIQLMARSGVSYNTTLMVASAASAQDYFIVAKHRMRIRSSIDSRRASSST